MRSFENKRSIAFVSIFMLTQTLYACGGGGGGGSTIPAPTPMPSPTTTPCSGPCLLAEYQLPDISANPFGITTGPDGNVWFTERLPTDNNIGRITPRGTITEFKIPTANADALSITPGPDGNLWFTESNAKKIGRITPTGSITEFAVPDFPSANIVEGPDHNLWFVGAGPSIDKMTTSGVVTKYPLTFTAGIGSITPGPDGNLWCLQLTGSMIVKMTTSGVATYYDIPSSSYNSAIAAGPGGLWYTSFTDVCSGLICALTNSDTNMTTTSGVTTVFPISYWVQPEGIVAGPDGNLWFIGNEVMGKITPAGKASLYSLGHAQPMGLTVGSDGNLWFTDQFLGRIGKFRI
ncbi:MAG: Virginiamycin B lyase [Candidatus Eremiobacteraeota bacterium]|nr:Virginiamycin B lyase [Candidatus Eremiobacteraeota bacterium]